MRARLAASSCAPAVATPLRFDPVLLLRRGGLLLRGVSAMTLAFVLATAPAHAQLARLRAAAGALTAPSVVATPTIVRPTNMREALARSQALQSRADTLKGYVTSARNAALLATRAQPTDGLSANGLDPIAAVRDAALLIAKGDPASKAQADALMAGVTADKDASGTATWQGASAPVQTSENGRAVVTITQNDARALLSWNKFDVGANTTLTFSQKANGVAQPSWTVVNRVVNSVAPSTVLGAIKADGTVLVLNQRGVIFGQGAQVNLHSLIVSSLELGNYAKNFQGSSEVTFDATTIKDRNTSFLQNGLFVTPPNTLPRLLLSPLYAPGTYSNDADAPTLIEGGIAIDPGATLTTDAGGYLIAAAPQIVNAGVLDATDGQVSLQAGRYIGVTASTGAAGSADPNTRGLILSSVQRDLPTAPPSAPATPQEGIILNEGLIRSRRGYLSLGTGLYGSVTNTGLLLGSTSVSRNGKIAITAGSVTLAGDADPARASGIEIDPDDDGETLPQGTADAPPAFKTSQIVIQDRATTFLDTGGAGVAFPGSVTMGPNAFILAPSADVTIGRRADDAGTANGFNGSIDIQSGAVIDVSGVKDVQLDAARNSLTITPVKRNELRDTPNYREVSTDGGFSLNGTTLTVDVRRSGVRADGVAWIGSPLIEAGSLASQIPVGAAELMTKGGTVNLGVSTVNVATDAALAPSIRIARDAVIDLSGGWVSYAAGTIATSRLIADDGRIVDIGDADPNDVYVGVLDGFTEAQPRFGISQTYTNPLLQGGQYEPGYDEGRDAGTLEISASSIGFDGIIHGDAFAGANQIANARPPSLASGLAGDPRGLQRDAEELPAGAFVKIGSFTGNTANPGADILVYSGTRGAAAANPAEMLLDAGMLSAARLSALTLQTSASITFASGTTTTLETADALTLTGRSALSLAPGGVLTADAGRAIRFDGDVTIPDGTIRARTYELGAGFVAGATSAIGSPFRADDDIAPVYALGTILPHPFDVTVTGTLSTAGRWANDYLDTAQPTGSAYTDGGTISLTVAPKVIVPLGDSVADARQAADLSGSIHIAPGALLDVSAGGYVAPDRALHLNGAGGDVSLINETTYASVTVTPNDVSADTPSTTAVSGQTVAFTPVPASDLLPPVLPSLVPEQPQATVDFAVSSLKGFGFSGGGTFRIVSPDLSFGDAADPSSIPLDFFARTGFGTLDATAYHARIVPTLFANGSTQASAFFDTTRLTVGAGQQLDLTQTVLPSLLDQDAVSALVNLASGSRPDAVLTPGIPVSTWDRSAATLTLRGLTELDVEAGGSIVGAPQARIVAPKLHNAGTITLPGGTIAQIATLPINLNKFGLGVADLSDVLGARDAQGLFDEGAANVAGVVDPATGTPLTNGQVFSTLGNERFVYLIGEVGAAQGIVLDAGSVTDVSGVALVDPRAPFRADGTQYRFGRVIAGGSIGTAAAFDTSGTDTARTLFSVPQFGDARYLDASQNPLDPPSVVAQIAPRAFLAGSGATIDLSGASATFDEPVDATTYAPAPQWSDAGDLALRSGGSFGGATVRASGGNAQATGGTLEWFDPTLRASFDGSAPTGTANIAYADGIEAAGFDTLIAYGGMTIDGDVSLTLGKALLVTSAPSIDGTRIGANAAVTIAATAGTTPTSATITAPYMHFSSRSGTVTTPAALPGTATVTFAAGAAGMDFSGGILFDPSIGQLNLASLGDVRLSGVDDRVSFNGSLPVLNGTLTAGGDIDFDAARVYTTTGTGNLQRILEDERIGASTATLQPYTLTALNDSTIRFSGTHIATDTPLSAGSYLRVQAGQVEQDGFLAAPLGRLEFGTLAAPIASVAFGAGSVTSVSGAGASIPYGTTTDLTEYFFTPGINTPVTTLPSGDLRITGSAIAVGSGATVDGRGGGSLFAYEFVSGTGGSRDELSRFNSDAFSSNDYDPASGTGYQFADQRQVYAIVPADQAQRIAAFDPIYSADYGAGSPADLYGAQAGLSVTLDGGGGVPAGQYLLLPAHYALMPGAYRVVENVGRAAPAPGLTQTLLDGSLVIGGTYSTAGTAFASSDRRSFTVQPQATVLAYSQIETTDGTATIQKQAATAGITPSRLPIDAARLVLNPLLSLTVAGTVETAAAAGGRGAQVDILGKTILISHSDVDPGDGRLLLTDTTLTNLDANSLVIGAQRFDNAEDTTRLGVTATGIEVAGDTSLAAPELVLAVAGQRSALTIDDGAQLRATGQLDDPRSGDYVIPSTADPDFFDPFDESGVGSVLRLANGVDRAVARQGDFAARNTLRPSILTLGAATLTGGTLSLDTSRRFFVDPGAELATASVLLSSDLIQFGGEAGSQEPGFRGIGPEFEAKLAAVDHLSLRSPDVIGFAPGTHSFHDLAVDSPGLALAFGTGGADTVSIQAENVRLSNAGKDGGACVAAGVRACSGTGNALIVDATSLTLGSGVFRTYGFDGAVTIAATQGSYYTGAGRLDVADAALTLRTPFLIDRAAVIDPALASATPSDRTVPAGNFTIPVLPNYVIATTGTVTISSPAAAAALPAPAGIRAPGSRIAIGSGAAPVAALTIDGTAITATAGVIDARATGDVRLASGASLATPGYTRTFGDAQDSTTISAGGGTVNLVSLTGDIALPAGTAIAVDNGVGTAGNLNLLASEGAIDLGATLNAGVTGDRTASLTFDAQKSAFDLDAFATDEARLFGGDLAIRSDVGDLMLGADHTLKATSVSLDADGGAVTIAGRIDTSGASLVGLDGDAARTARVDGGDIALYGENGVALRAGATLDTHTGGYADTDTRQAHAGDVKIGIGMGGGALTIEPGATIDVSATRTLAAQAAGDTGNRLIPVTVKDPATLTDTTVYKLVLADSGGAVELRVPVTGTRSNIIDVRLGGAIVGASERSIEGYKRYQLDDLAASGLYSGIVASPTGVALNLIDDTETTGLPNLLSEDFVGADGTPSLVRFVRRFAPKAADGESLAGFDLRPGLELVSSGDVELDSNWNLAAGIVNQRRAAANGVLIAEPELGTRDDGTPYYRVASGREGDLLADYTNFLYRVGGKASGQAAVLTLRAGHDLDITHSITDGFFTFDDKSDPAYISYQLGGGDRVYSPALPLVCGGTSGDCAAIVNYADVANGAVAPDPSTTLTIGLTTAARGDPEGASYVNSPYDPLANSAAALGSGIDPDTGEAAGDPLAFAQLFPLLPDGTAMRSTSLRLVGGAGGAVSADPLHVDRGSGGSVVTSGETSYRLTATAGTASPGDTLQLKLRAPLDPNNPAPIFNLNTLLGTDQSLSSVDLLTADSYTVLTYGGGLSGAAADERAAAEAYFADKPASFQTVGGRTIRVAARLGDVLGFLQQFAPTLIAGIQAGDQGYPRFGTSNPALVSFGNQPAYSRTLVRTGNGSIDVAAGGDVDLRGTPDIVYRTATGASRSNPLAGSAQVGGTAIYTAGQRVSPEVVEARMVGGGAVLSVAPDSPYLSIAPEQVDFIPSPKQLTDQAGVLATDGGNVSIAAGGSILGRRDVASERFLDKGTPYSGGRETSYVGSQIGDAADRWRIGLVGQDTEIAIAPRYFASGIGALAGGDVSIRSGDDVTDLTIALDNGVTTSDTAAGKVQIAYGAGDLDARIGGDLRAGQIDVADGEARIAVGDSVTAFGTEPSPSQISSDPAQYLRLRVADATVSLTSTGSAALVSIGALGAASSDSSSDQYNSAGFFSPTAGVAIESSGDLALTGNRSDQAVPFDAGDGVQTFGLVLPPSLSLASLSGDLVNPSLAPLLLFPSPEGQLTLASAGDIDRLVLAMSDSDPSLLPGNFSAAGASFAQGRVTAEAGLAFGMPGVLPTTDDRTLRLYHNQHTTHAGDATPVQIYAGNDIVDSVINLPKQARIGAGRDIDNLYFTGQNVDASDVTRVRAGRDIIGTTSASADTNLPYVISSDYELGGPGTLSIEAGRNLGPFINSAVVDTVRYAGGIRTVGNDDNPWFAPAGADISVLFGTAKGVDYAALREAYLNPANFSQLDGDLFVQVADSFGNQHPDRSRQVYAPILAAWLRDNDPAAFAQILGTTPFADDAALATAAYAKMGDLYTAFAALAPIQQDKFLIGNLYFNELKQPALPTSPSYLQYIRGYRAVQTLFPTSLGYTDNLAPYTVNPSTVNADHPLGVPTRAIVNGQPEQATRVQTGNVDLRLATIETTRGGNVTLIGPGGDFIAGSVVRTSEQAARRVTRFGVAPIDSIAFGAVLNRNTRLIDAIPLGFEGVLTLRGGSVQGFTDGNFRVNQSRVFTQAGGDIELWSSNGDLNAGQGPRSAANFPPITVRFDQDGFAETDTAGSVAGAGIGAFKREPTDPDSSIVLIAPVGLVDAGDAGVRASGDIFVAAARVANADSFSAGGSISGVPSLAGAGVSVAPTAASSALISQVAQLSNGGNADRRSQISVDVLGYAGGQDPCADPKSNDPSCHKAPAGGM